MVIDDGVELPATALERVSPARPVWLRVVVAVVTPLAVASLWSCASWLVQGRLVDLPEYEESSSWTGGVGVFTVLTLVLDLANLVERAPRTQLRNWLIFQGALIVSLVASTIVMDSGQAAVPVPALAVAVGAASAGLLPLVAYARWPRTWWFAPLAAAVLVVVVAVPVARSLTLEPTEDPSFGEPVACSEVQTQTLDALEAVLPPDPVLGSALPGESFEGMCHWYSSTSLAPDEAAAAVTSVLEARGYTVSASTDAIDGLVLSADGSAREPVWVALSGGQFEDSDTWSTELEVHVGPGALTAHSLEGGDPS